MSKRTQEEIMASWKDDATKPLVSVCTITYNHEKFIAEALDSFLMQETDFPFEIVVDDDCSTDNNAQIIKEYADRFPHIIKANLREKNVGMMANFIANMKRAKGEYIALCEGDDYWTDPLKLQKQMDFLAKNVEYSVCYHKAKSIDKNNNIVSKSIFDKYYDYSEDDLIEGRGILITSTMMFRKNVIRDIMKFTKAPNGDTLLWHLLGFYGKCKYLENIEDAVYRIHDNGVWSGSKMSKRLDMAITTYSIIRKNISIQKGKKSKSLRGFDKTVSRTFDSYFFYWIYARNIRGYIDCLRLWIKASGLNRCNVICFHIKHLYSVVSQKISIRLRIIGRKVF